MDQTIRLTTYRKSPFHRWYLFFEHVRSTRNGMTQKVLFQCCPMPIYESERELRGGRFHNYDPDQQEHRVNVPFNEGEMLKHINWIADHSSAWNAFIIPDHGDDSEIPSDYTVCYSFAESSDAVLFKLVFG